MRKLALALCVWLVASSAHALDYLGSFAEDSTVNYQFTTNAADGAPIAPNSAFEAADVRIYKDNSATQKTATDGVTMTSPFDSATGLHQISIDTSNDTNDASFWQSGHDYTVVLVADETVDGVAVTSVLAQFSIANRDIRANVIQVGGDAQSLTDLKDFADAGYDPSTNKVDGVATIISEQSLHSVDLDAIRTAVETAIPNALAVIDDFLDTEIAAILADTNELQVDWVNGGRLDLLIDAIKAVTDKLNTGVELDGSVYRWTTNALEQGPSGEGGSGGDGSGYTAIPWNPAWDAEVQSEVADAFGVYDPPTNAEMEARTLAAASYATASALSATKTVVDAIKVKTDLIPTTIDGLTLQETLAILLAGMGGDITGGQDSPVAKSPTGETRISATVDEDGNRETTLNVTNPN